MTGRAHGLAVSDRFRRYMAQLRKTWPADEQALAAARGGDELTFSNAA